MFGDHRVCGAFPTASPMVKRQQSILVQVPVRAFAHIGEFFSEIDLQDTPQLVRLRSDRPASTPYMCFDEAYFKTLESMQWNRDNGCIELVPISVGLP